MTRTKIYQKTFLFLLNHSIVMKVIGMQVKRDGGYGHEILVKHSVYGPHNVIQWIISHIFEELKYAWNKTE